jgi:Tol biopolymer transport system component
MLTPSNGGQPTQLTFDKGKSWPHSFSPDGDKIVFAGQRDGVWNIYSISISSKIQKRLTNYAKLNAFVRYPSWSRNQIVYEYAETTGNLWMLELE